MKTFATKEKASSPAMYNKGHSYIHHPIGPMQQNQLTMISNILRSTNVQAKLTLGEPNDKYEQEADRVADKVMAMPDTKLQRQSENEEEKEALQTKSLADQITPLVQRQEETPEEEEPIQAKSMSGQIPDIQCLCSVCDEKMAQRQPEENEDEELQAKSKAGETSRVIPNLESRISSIKTGGQPLDPTTRAFFEPRFGYNFSHVRVHSDSATADTAKSINARAFTLGNHVAMGSSEYQPNSRSGQRLLGHELAHVVQQTSNNDLHKSAWNSTIINRPNVSVKQRPRASVIQRWSYGSGAGPLAHYVEVPSRERGRVNAAMRIVERVVNNPRNYPRCHRAFQNECPSPSAQELVDRFNAAVVWRRSTQNSTFYYGGSVAPDHMAYTERTWRWGRWMIANTAIHEMVHRCGFHNESRINRIAEICGMPAKPT